MTDAAITRRNRVVRIVGRQRLDGDMLENALRSGKSQERS